MPLALDANHHLTMIREEDQIGGLIRVSDGDLIRLMPEGDAAAVVADNNHALNIGTLSTAIGSVFGWNLMILNEGYFQPNKIVDYDSGIVTLKDSLEFHSQLSELGSAVEWVAYPTVDLPVGIVYKPETADSTLTVGVVRENLHRPAMRPYAVLDAGQMLVLHTRQIQKFFIQAPSASSADPDIVMWGESYIA